MEWLTGLALLPVVVCGTMMGAMALAGVLGLRRSQDSSRQQTATHEQIADERRDEVSP
ncbi:MAG: hypothetical protein ACRD0U_08300 [Acidimicrobiales bacterium]